MSRRSPVDSSLGDVDPRSKLLLQIAFVGAAYAHTEPLPLVVLAGVSALVYRLGGQSWLAAVWEFRLVALFLGFATVLAGVTTRSPFFAPGEAVEPGLAAVRVFLVVIVSIAIVRTTPSREVEAALRWLVPGRIGRLVATGVGLVFRFTPVIRTEANRTRRAVRARGGDALRLDRRIQLVGIVTLVRLLRRTDRVSQALRVRCLSWNATVPPLGFSKPDVPALAASTTLLAWATAGWLG